MNPAQLDTLLESREDYNLEFKEAKRRFSLKELHDYCAAIANETGGHLLLGVNNDRRIVGTKEFDGTWNTLAHTLSEHLHIRVKVYEVMHKDGRVLAFDISRHSAGRPVKVTGGSGNYVYPIRDGECLVEMSADTYRTIIQELQVDFSAQTVDGIGYQDLDQDALYDYRQRWATHTKNSEHLAKKYPQMLADLGLLRNGKLTHAALLLFGTDALLRDYLPDAEIVFEWRNDASEIAYGARSSWRAGFMVIADDIWRTVASRNTTFRYQEGFIQREIDAYDERSVREAITNAFVHRDYSLAGNSIIIRVSPDRFYVENPGSFMAGVTIDNIMDKSVYRNRLLAESLEKVNIMERSSQGVDTIFKRAIEDGKGKPVYRVTSDPSIQLSIPALLVDREFVKFVEEAINRRHARLSPREMLELELIRTGEKRNNLQFRDKLLELGLIERYGQGRGQKYVLSHKYYSASGNSGEYTRITGLNREMKRAIIEEHLKKHGRITSKEVQSALPDMTALQISTLLKGMRQDGIIEYHGASPRWGYWSLTQKP